jgi:hypothetical protein
MIGHRIGGSRMTPPSAQAADVGQGMRSRCIWLFSQAEPTRSSVSMPKRPALPDPPHPQILLHTGEPQAGQAGLAFGRPTLGLPLDRLVGPAGRPAAWQLVLVEPVPDRGWMHAKLAGDAGGWHRRVIARSARYARREAKPSSAALVVSRWSVAPRVGGGHPVGDGVMPAVSSRRRTTVVVVPSSLASCAGLTRCWARAWR